MTESSSCTYGPYTAHPAADLFPLITGAEFDELVDDIKKNGQLDNIQVLIGTGQILDGRNRYRACVAAGVEPHVNQHPLFDQGPTEYVISKNLKRRNLTPDQRAAIADNARGPIAEEAKARKAEGQQRGGEVHNLLDSETGVKQLEERNERSTLGKLAGMANVSRYKVEQAKKIREADAELASDVRAGKITAVEAMKKIAPVPAKPADRWKKERAAFAKISRIPQDRLLEFAEQDSEAQAWLVTLFDSANERGTV
jgi:ParB-like chromosome segregation protein Spo0J